MEYNISGRRVGSVFPRDPMENFDHPINELTEIYHKLCELYAQGKWTLEDFKSYRRALASKTTQEVKSYGDIVLYLLSLAPEEMQKFVMEVDQKLECHLMERREKFIEIDSNTGNRKECYHMVPRNFETGIMVELANAIDGKMNNCVLEVISENVQIDPTLSLKQQLKVYQEVLNRLDCGTTSEINLLEKLYQAYEEKFGFLREIPQLESYFLRQKEKIKICAANRLGKIIQTIKRNMERDARLHNCVNTQNIWAKMALKKANERRYYRV